MFLPKYSLEIKIKRKKYIKNIKPPQKYAIVFSLGKGIRGRNESFVCDMRESVQLALQGANGGRGTKNSKKFHLSKGIDD